MFTRRNSHSALAAALLFSVVAACLVGAAPFNDGFASPKMQEYIPNYEELRYDLAFEKVAGMQGKQCLRLRNENEKLEAKFVLQPVVPGKQYEVSFRSKFVNSETLETNPTLEETTRPGWKLRYRYLPIFEIVFLDKDKSALRTTTTVALPYGEWWMHRDVFTAPPNAEFVQFAFSSGINSGVLYLDDMRFAARNTNPAK